MVHTVHSKVNMDCNADSQCAWVQHALLQVTHLAAVPWAFDSGLLALDNDSSRRHTCFISGGDGVCRHPLRKDTGPAFSGFIPYTYTRSACKGLLMHCCTIAFITAVNELLTNAGVLHSL